MRRDLYKEYARIEDRHWWFIGRKRILMSLIDDFLEPTGGVLRRILDVGCGTGGMLLSLQAFGDVEGIDADASAIAYCRERGITTARLADSPPIPFPDHEFDVVTSFDVLEHVDDDTGLLDEIHRVLAPGGLFVVAVPAYEMLWGLQDEVAHHRRRYRARDLSRRLAGSKLKPKKVSYFNTFLFPPIAAIRLGRRLLPRGSSPSSSDFDLTAEGKLNDLLARIFSAEAPVVKRWGFPFGVSIVAIAQAMPASDA
jgi:SAM-dependent methyltransferase